MKLRDWRNPDDYAFTNDLSSELWAWQFLRRNPGYRKDYDWFVTAWRALEADYGVAPNRDFPRWKLDERAYAPDEMTQNFCDNDKSCASPGGSKVMIECAMGAKWGFYKFPNSPDIEFPDVPGKLIWREFDLRVAKPAGEAQSFEIDLRFDLRLSLYEQLRSARQQLIIQQRQQQGDEFGVDTLTAYLRLIDARDSSDHEILEQLYEGDLERLAGSRQRAFELCEKDYRLLLVKKS